MCLFSDDPMSSQQYHQEYNPPVEGSYTGINKHEKVIPVTDPSNDREQVQQRLAFLFILVYSIIKQSYFNEMNGIVLWNLREMKYDRVEA